LFATPVDITHTNIIIPAGSSAFIDLSSASSEPVLPSDYFGAAYVTASTPVAVIVNQNAAGALLVYRGFTTADRSQTLVVTQAVSQIYDGGQQLNYGSAIEGMTYDGSDTQVTFLFTNLLGGGTKSCIIPTVSGRFRHDQRPAYWGSCTLPTNSQGQFFGTVALTSAGAPIIAINNLQSDFSSARGIRALTGRAFITSGGSTTGFAPLLMRDYYDAGTNATWGTALEGRFLSGTGTATITYYDIDSSSQWTDTYIAGSDQIFRFDQRSANTQTSFILPSPKRVSAKVTASQPFVFTINTQAGSATQGDALGIYQLSR
jgi:hypothetical protein